MVAKLDIKLGRDLWRSRWMLLAVASIISVGTGSMVCMLATVSNLSDARNAYYAQCRMADFWVDLKKAPISALDEVAGLPGVAAVRDRIVFPVVVDIEGEAKPVAGLAISMPGTPTPVLNDIVLQRGRYFDPEGRDEVIVSDKFAGSRNLAPGSTVRLILNGQLRSLQMVGAAIGPEFIYLVPPGSLADNPREYGVFYVTKEFAEEAFGFHGAFNSLTGTLTPGARDHPAPVLAELARRLDAYGVFQSTPLAQQASNLTLSAELGGLQSMAMLFPLLFLGVAALVLNVLMMRMAEQQRAIVGTLKALGYDSGRINRHFLKFGLVVGAMGGLGGGVLGYGLAEGMTHMYQGIFTFPTLANRFYAGLSLVAMAVSIGFAALGAARGVRKVGRLNPAEAMRDAAPPLCGAVLLERWPGLWSRLDFRWQVVLRGLFRNRMRTAMSLVAAAFGAALVLLALGFVDSLNAMISFQFDKVMPYDYAVHLKEEAGAGALLEIRRLPGVMRAEPVFEVSGTLRHGKARKQGVITGLSSGAKLTIPCRADGTPARVPPQGLLMTKRLAGQLWGDPRRFDRAPAGQGRARPDLHARRRPGGQHDRVERLCRF